MLLVQAFFSPILRQQAQQNFRNLEFKREILEFSEKSFHFDGGNLEFLLCLEEKPCFLAEKTLSLENFLSLAKIGEKKPDLWIMFFSSIYLYDFVY